jgi:hypothetical protein
MFAAVASAAFFGVFGLAGQASAESDAGATVNVAHFAPFASDLNGTSVSVLVNSGEVISDFVFGETETGIPLPAGTYTVEIVPTGTITPAISGTFELQDGVDYTLAAIGGNGYPLKLDAKVNQTEGFTDTGKIRITHFAPFATPVSATAVDICTEDGTAVPGLTNVQYEDSPGYLPLPAGIYDLVISAAGTDCAPVLDIPPFALKVGQVADVYAIGLLSPSDLALQISQWGLQANIAVAHLAPFANSVPGTSVTIKLDGSDVLTDVVFADISPYIPVDPGSYSVEVVPTGTSDPAITGTAVISGLVDFTFAAIGDVVNQPLELVRYEDDNATVPPAGKARVRIAHLASVASDLAQTRVDLCVASDQTALLQDFEYKQDVTLDLDAGVYDLYLAAAGASCASPLIDIPEFVLSDGDIAYAYAAGDIVNLPPTVVSVPPLTPPARVNVAHFAPFADTIAGTEVTVEANGQPLLTGFTYPSTTGYVSLPAGTYDIAIFPTAGASAAATPAISATVNISAGVDYTAAAIGDGTNQPLELKPYVDDNSPPPEGKGRVRVAHLAPFADTLEGTTVDLCTSVGGTPLVNDFQYGQDALLILDPGIYTGVFIGAASPDCSAVALPVPTFVVTDGGIGYVYAIGDVTNQPLSVVATPASLVAEEVSLPSLFLTAE